LKGSSTSSPDGLPSVGIFTSEGGQFLGGHGMSDDAKTRTITGLSKLWDIGAAQRVRAKEVTIINGRRVSVSLAVQPKIAASLLGDDLARDQGFVGRFLMTMPESRIGLREIRASAPHTDPRLQNFNLSLRRLFALPFPLKSGARNELEPRDLKFDGDAWEAWQALAQHLETESGKDGRWRPVKSSALKMAENVARIAGIRPSLRTLEPWKSPQRR
jgi:hypothetical protein